MLPPQDVYCHHTAFKKRCFDMVTKCKCPKWRQLQGKHPQTGADMDHWDCVDGLVPMLLMEVGKQQMATAAAIQNVAAEVKKTDAASAAAVTTMATIANRLIDRPIPPRIANGTDMEALIAPEAPRLMIEQN